MGELRFQTLSQLVKKTVKKLICDDSELGSVGLTRHNGHSGSDSFEFELLTMASIRNAGKIMEWSGNMLFRRLSFAAIAALACLVISNDAMAQRGGFGGRGRGASKLEYLSNPQVQEELDMLEDQQADLQEINDEARNIMRSAFTGMREKFQDLSREERDEMMTEIREKITKDMKEVEAKLGDILVPHQMERLEQLVLQGQMRRGGTAAALQSEAMREKLGLTEEEAEKLAAKEEEVKKELEEQIKELRAKAQDKILSVLPAEKQEKIKNMIGDAFEMTRNNTRRGRGGDRGDRGDRGRRGGGGR